MHALDCHIHLDQADPDPAALAADLRAAGLDGGVLISPRPAVFYQGRPDAPDTRPAARLENLLAWAPPLAAPPAAGQLELYPFFWIDPTEPSALDQVARAVAAGVAGFKVIPSTHDPCVAEAMPVYRAIADAGRPLLFHSGILWDGKPSSHHCRPVLFEPLLEVPRLRFALAHISWPWTDECIAVYGKFRAAKQARPDLSCEMFVDTTPGTPVIYRTDALTKLISVPYGLQTNTLFGTDCTVPGYSAARAAERLQRDRGIYAGLGLSDSDQQAIFTTNLRRLIANR